MLAPGGTFYMVEFHPTLWMLSDDHQRIEYPYQRSGPISETNTGTYTDRSADIETTNHGWNHGLGDVLSSLTGAGLQIEFLHEHNDSPYDIFERTNDLGNGRYMIQGLENMIPLMYSLKARKT